MVKFTIDNLESIKQLVELKVFDINETIPGKLLYTKIPDMKKVKIKDLDFYPCIDDMDETITYVYQSDKKVLYLSFPEITQAELDTLLKFQEYSKRIDKFESNPILTVFSSVITLIFLGFIIYSIVTAS